MNLNQVFFAGHLTSDPELRYTSNGLAACTIRVASNRRFQSKGGESKEESCFMNVDTFGKSAEACGEHLKKGAQVLVEGRLKLKEWTGKDGQKRQSVDIVADRVQFVSGSGKAYNAPAPTPDAPAGDDIPF